MSDILVVGIEMGYGHLRAAAPLAERLGVPVLHADRPPLADELEQNQWGRARKSYELVTRLASQAGLLRHPLQSILDGLTAIPHLHPYRDLSKPGAAVHYLSRAIRNGLGQGMVEQLKSRQATLLTTYFAPALAADHHGCDDIYCVVTDSDIHRIWAPPNPQSTRIQYLVPSQRAMRRLQSYGVPPERITSTGFPLPHELLGGPELVVLRKHVAERLVRLDPKGVFRDIYRDELTHFLGVLPSSLLGAPPRVTFAVGGAGAQVALGEQLMRSLRPLIEDGRIRLTLVAGVRSEVAERMQAQVATLRLESALADRRVEVLFESRMDTYFTRFNALLAETDILWTKPSELTFYGALGLALVLAPPVGVHEANNRRWAREAGAGLKQRDVRFAAEWITEWLADGTLAGAAWAGFMRLPKFGTYRIIETVRELPRLRQ